MFLKELAVWLIIISALTIAPLGCPHLETTIEIPSIDGNLVVSICSAIIAACALGLTVWQGHQSRKHNIKTVQPMLTFKSDIHTDGLYFNLILANHGFGPALIEDFKLTLDGEEPPGVGKEKLYNAFSTALENHNFNYKFTHLEKGYVVPSNGICEIASISFENKTESLSNVLNTGLERMDLYVGYSSIYGIKDSIKTGSRLQMSD